MILIFRITTASQSRSSCKNLCRAQNIDDSVSFTENLLNIFETKLHKKKPSFSKKLHLHLPNSRKSVVRATQA